jgi:hypothetical protein
MWIAALRLAFAHPGTVPLNNTAPEIINNHLNSAMALVDKIPASRVPVNNEPVQTASLSA